MDKQIVNLSIPAQPDFARTVRMMAASLAVISGQSVEDVEDARMAAEEAFVWCCASGPAACDIEFQVAEGYLGAKFAFGPNDLPEDDPASTYAELILNAVCDECVFDRSTRTLHLSKSVDVADA